MHPVPDNSLSDSAEYVQCLLFEDLGSYKKNSPPSSKQPISMYTCASNPSQFTVVKYFGPNDAREFRFEVKKCSPSKYISNYIITGQALLQHHKKEIHFSSSYSFRKYLKDHLYRPILTTEAEETAHHVDQLMQVYRASLADHELNLLVQSRQNPTVVVFAQPIGSRVIKELYFECQKTHEKASSSGFKFRSLCQKNTDSITTIYSGHTLLNYFTCLENSTCMQAPQEPCINHRAKFG